MNKSMIASLRRDSYQGEWLVLVVGLLMLGVVLVYAFSTERIELDKRERERLLNQTRIVNDNLLRQIDSIYRALINVRDDLPRLRGEKEGLAGVNRRLSAFTDAMPGVRTMMLMDADGRIVATNRAELLGRNVAAREYFALPRDGGDAGMLYISPPFRSALGNYVINVSLSLLDADGRFAGVISAALDPEEFKILLDSVRYAADMWAALVHGEGKLFLMMPERTDLAGLDLAKSGSIFMRHKESGQAGSVHVGRVAFAEGERMAAVRTIMPVVPRMNMPLVIGLSRDVGALFAEWNRAVRVVGSLYAALVLFSISTLAFVQGRRRKAAAALHAAEAEASERSAELEQFFSVTPDLLCIADQDGRFRKLNPAWERTFGYSAAELEGERFLDYVHPDDVEATVESIKELNYGARMIGYVNRFRCADGSYRDIEWHAVSYGELSYAAARDVTEQRRTLRELTTAKLAADAASQAKSEFLANMSHEIRTPMNAVIGLMQLVEHTALTPRQADYVAKAQAAAASLLGIINDILDFSKVEAGKLAIEQEPFRLDTLLDNLSVVLATAAQDKSIAVAIAVAPDVPRLLRGDALRLQQVLLNLGGNAIKFTAAGQVTLEVGLVALSGTRARIEFSVRDTGIGIAEDKLQSIFEVFTQAEASTTRRFGGTGLGLAISQRLVRLMGGGLRVESALGEGSCFSFALDFPLADAAELPAETPRVAAMTGTRRLAGLRVLLVEDNLMNQLVARDLLIQEGANVEVAANGREGVDRVLAAATPFDAVLMDVQMPVMDGHAATRILREQHGLRDLPIIAMTANALPADRAASLAAGMNDHIGKPFSLGQLVASLARHCPRLGGAPTFAGERSLPAAPAVATSPDFDVASALTRFENDSEIYLRVVDSFRKGEEALRAELHAALAAGDLVTAARTLHTLKGLAATLGATRLSTFARMAEAKLKEGSADPARLPAELDMELMLALDELDNIAAQLAAPAKTVTAGGGVGGAVPAERLREFVALLAAGNMRALDVYRALIRDYPEACAEQRLELDAALARLDFAAAAALCRHFVGEA